MNGEHMRTITIELFDDGYDTLESAAEDKGVSLEAFVQGIVEAYASLNRFELLDTDIGPFLAGWCDAEREKNEQHI